MPLKLPKLSLPEFEPKIAEREDGYYILDEFRQKFVKLTPEEWVRQNFVHFLINVMKYPRGLMKIEHSIIVQKVKKRCDAVIFRPNLSVFMIVECKADNVSISDEVLRQAAIYNSSLNAEYLTLTNGMTHICMKFNTETRMFDFTGSLPVY